MQWFAFGLVVAASIGLLLWRGRALFDIGFRKRHL
jgi:hypothetical protein